MADIQEIDKGIGAHGLWKARLKSAIDAGHMDTPVEVIRKDDQCAFGKWLHGPTLSAADKASSHYRIVRDLHAEFHRTAARVAELALAGKKADAEKQMALGGEYANVSTKLTAAMMAWKQSLG